LERGIVITVGIVGDYNNDHHYERTVAVAGPTAEERNDLGEWWWDVVYPETGDNQTERGVEGIHTCTILAADPPDNDLVGVTYDLGG
jgi:hypothetical protein